MATLYEEMRKGALINPDAEAIVFYGKRYKFKQILSLVEKTAAGLKAIGVQKGSVVTLCMPNTPSAHIAFYAINRLGAIVNLVHPLASAHQLQQSISESQSSFLIVYDLFLKEKGGLLNTDIPVIKSRSNYFMPSVAKMVFKWINRKKPTEGGDAKRNYIILESLFKGIEIVDPCEKEEENSPAVYLPSGGTLGRPKIIMHTSDVFNKLCGKAQFFLSEPLKNYSAMYSVLPIFHGFGLCMNMHMCATLGLKNVMSIKFKPKSMLKAIKKERVNVITGVPAMYSKLLACPEIKKTDLSSLKDCFVGGDSAPKKLVEDFNLALQEGGSKGGLYVGYGLTETVTVCTVTCKNHNRAESIGYPLPDVKIKIVADGKVLNAGEIGEICISTPLLMLGYLGEGDNPMRTENGEKWLYTGDLGYLDADGFLYFKQRIKNMIKVNGVPVFPSEIEEAAESIAGVIRAAAIAVDDTKTGQTAKLFVESTTEDTEGLKEEIICECKKRLSLYAVPKYIEVRKTLPLNTIGKIDRKQLE